MSTEVYLEADLGRGLVKLPPLYGWTFSANTHKMLDAIGLILGDWHNKEVKYILTEISAAVVQLRVNETYLRTLEVRHDWGNYNDLLGTLDTMYNVCYNVPKAIVNVA